MAYVQSERSPALCKQLGESGVWITLAAPTLNIHSLLQVLKSFCNTCFQYTSFVACVGRSHTVWSLKEWIPKRKLHKLGFVWCIRDWDVGPWAWATGEQMSVTASNLLFDLFKHLEIWKGLGFHLSLEDKCVRAIKYQSILSHQPMDLTNPADPPYLPVFWSIRITRHPHTWASRSPGPWCNVEKPAVVLMSKPFQGADDQNTTWHLPACAGKPPGSPLSYPTPLISMLTNPLVWL